MPQNGKLQVLVDSLLTNALDLNTVESQLSKRYEYDFPTGTAANKADKVFSDTRTIAASGAEDLDLAGGLTDAFGAAITFVEVRALVIKAAAGNTNDVVVGGDASAAWAAMFGDATDKINVKPGGIFVWIAPGDGAGAVTATTADLLQIANSGSGTSVTYDIIILGTSA